MITISITSAREEAGAGGDEEAQRVVDDPHPVAVAADDLVAGQRQAALGEVAGDDLRGREHVDFGRHVLELAGDGVVEHRHPERQVGPHVGAQQGQPQGVGVVAGDHGDGAPVALAQHLRGFAVAQVEGRGGRRAALLQAPQQRRAEPATLAEDEDGARSARCADQAGWACEVCGVWVTVPRFS